MIRARRARVRSTWAIRFRVAGFITGHSLTQSALRVKHCHADFTENPVFMGLKSWSEIALCGHARTGIGGSQREPAKPRQEDETE